MDPFVFSTIFLAMWGAVGPLVGVRYGQELARKWQRKHWINENKKSEYKQLLESFNDLHLAIIRAFGTVYPNAECDGATAALARTANTALFIRDFLEKSKIVDDFTNSIGSLLVHRNFEQFQAEYFAMENKIVKAASEIRI